jgi:hypothetical protein
MKVCIALALLGTLCLTGVAATLNTTTRRTAFARSRLSASHPTVPNLRNRRSLGKSVDDQFPGILGAGHVLDLPDIERQHLQKDMELLGQKNSLVELTGVPTTLDGFQKQVSLWGN